MPEGRLHSDACLVGTSHEVPGACRGADGGPIVYPPIEPDALPGPTDPLTNSEEGQASLAVAEPAAEVAEPEPEPEAP